MNTNAKGGSGSHRIARIEKEIREVVGTYILFRFSSDLPGIVSVSRVIVSKDIRTAKVLVTLMSAPGGDPDQNLSRERVQLIDELKRHAYEVQGEVNRKLRMKFTPRIAFHYDDGFEHAMKVQNILREIIPPEVEASGLEAESRTEGVPNRRGGEDAKGGDGDES